MLLPAMVPDQGTVPVAGMTEAVAPSRHRLVKHPAFCRGSVGIGRRAKQHGAGPLSHDVG